MHPQNFMIFGTYKLHNAESEIVNFLSLCQLLFARGRCIIAVLLSLNF